MKSNQSRSRIGGAILAFSLLFGIGIILSTAAQAQNPDGRYTQDRDRNDNGDQNRRGRNWDRYGSYGGSSELRQTALNAGYNEGIKQARDDRNSRNYSDYRNRGAYRNATKGYNSRLGDRELYRRYFREAYENGYNAESYAQGRSDRDDRYRDRDRNDNGDRNRRGRNWDRYDNYGGSFALRQTALNAGYNEGIKEGRKDRGRARRTDYRNNSAYRNATKDYSSRLGDRELYKRYYRQGYENGYNDGLDGN